MLQKNIGSCDFVTRADIFLLVFVWVFFFSIQNTQNIIMGANVHLVYGELQSNCAQKQFRSGYSIGQFNEYCVFSWICVYVFFCSFHNDIPTSWFVFILSVHYFSQWHLNLLFYLICTKSIEQNIPSLSLLFPLCLRSLWLVGAWATVISSTCATDTKPVEKLF